MNTEIDLPAQAGSNSLPDLAVRIRAEHEAVDQSLKSSVAHAMAAGDMLIEAKSLVKHGQWLPWLHEHCTISERTAQLYMRCAKQREVIESNTQPIADLSLNEAAALLMLSSDARKILSLVRDMENLGPEELVDFCTKNDIAVLRTNPFGATEFDKLPEPEQNEWRLWSLFLVKDKGASLDEAGYYTDRLQSRGWSLSEWYGPEGDRYRASLGKPWLDTQSMKNRWLSFFEANRSRPTQDITNEINKLGDEWLAKRKEREARSEARKKARKARSISAITEMTHG
jgi:Protein of unknown function (DUF3102)